MVHLNASIVQFDRHCKFGVSSYESRFVTMVGVPGRSKGCNTCIKRRVKVGNHSTNSYL